MNVLALDPSLNATGWAIFSDRTLVDFGWIPTERSVSQPLKSFDDASRAFNLALSINSLVYEYAVEFVVYEVSFGSQNARAASYLGLAKGVVSAIIAVKDLNLKMLTPFEIKRVVCGNRNASKEDIIAAVEKKYKKVAKKKDWKRTTRTGSFTAQHQAACDAIATFMTYEQTNR